MCASTCAPGRATAEPTSWREECDDDDDEGEEVLTARTRAVLYLAPQHVSDQAWQEVSTLGDQPAQRSAGGVFGSLPWVTWHQDGTWRRQMVRAFDDLAADCSSDAEVEPRCTGEEMALHLGIARAQDLTRNRPWLVRDTVAGLPETEGLRLGCLPRRPLPESRRADAVHHALDGMEDPEGDIHQSLGMVDLAPHDWFVAFDPEQARDPDRGFRHP